MRSERESAIICVWSRISCVTCVCDIVFSVFLSYSVFTIKYQTIACSNFDEFRFEFSIRFAQKLCLLKSIKFRSKRILSDNKSIGAIVAEKIRIIHIGYFRCTAQSCKYIQFYWWTCLFCWGNVEIVTRLTECDWSIFVINTYFISSKQIQFKLATRVRFSVSIWCFA